MGGRNKHMDHPTVGDLWDTVEWGVGQESEGQGKVTPKSGRGLQPLGGENSREKKEFILFIPSSSLCKK